MTAQLMILQTPSYVWASTRTSPDSNLTIKIIALAPHITEIVYAAGAGASLIAVDSASDYPTSVAQLPHVASFAGLDLEKILTLQPDLLIAWTSGSNKTQLAQLRAFGIKIYHSDPMSIEALMSQILHIGRLANTYSVAEKNVQQLRQKYQSLRKKYRHKTRIKVFYQVWQRPLMTIGGKHLISAMIELCGGENIFHKLLPLSIQVNMEALVKANPEIIVYPAGVSAATWRSQWLKLKGLKAVQHPHIYSLDPDLIARSGPRILEGTQHLCEYIDLVRQNR